MVMLGTLVSLWLCLAHTAAHRGEPHRVGAPHADSRQTSQREGKSEPGPMLPELDGASYHLVLGEELRAGPKVESVP